MIKEGWKVRGLDTMHARLQCKDSSACRPAEATPSKKYIYRYIKRHKNTKMVWKKHICSRLLKQFSSILWMRIGREMTSEIQRTHICWKRDNS